MKPGDQSGSEGLYSYIEGLRIRRFTEAFYMTYRNMHLIERGALFDRPTVGLAHRVKPNVENHVKPIFDAIGYNQSIYLLWPVVTLLRAAS
jgi:hypothetical protein